MSSIKILFASPEVSPFAQTGGLADVSGSLPRALHDAGCKVTVILPFYKSVKETVVTNLSSFSTAEFNFLKYSASGVDYCFVAKDEYYGRENLYSEQEGDYPDNDVRFSYFAKAVVDFAVKSGEKPDIIHLNDWQTGLVPLYLKMKNIGIKTLFTIHNIAYQGVFRHDALGRLGIPRSFYGINGIEYYRKISFLKAGIVYSTAISTVSKKYSREIMTPEFGYGMDGILRRRLGDIYGIVNGIDEDKWDPATDQYIVEHYNAENIEKKSVCKKDLLEIVRLSPAEPGRPLIGVISRLAEQKGIDLLIAAAKEIIDLGASVVILGSGDARYESLVQAIAAKYPKFISSQIKFDDKLAHKIEAGSDMLAMPSRYEPCGLNQLYSMRYGTVPIVRATGGLDDTVIDLYADAENGNGIKFPNATKEDLVGAVYRAIKLYNDKEAWQNIIKRIMKLDFSWNASALRYKELYESLLNK